MKWHCIKNKKKLQFGIPFIGILCSLLSCNYEIKDTKISVKNPSRHYRPLLQGQELKIQYEVKNIGTSPLNVAEVFTSCGCILVDNSTMKNIPPNGSFFLKMTYDSNKNIGLVEHKIYLYGNFNDAKPFELKFDVNVVPDALYTKDYEELYEQENINLEEQEREKK